VGALQGDSGRPEFLPDLARCPTAGLVCQRSRSTVQARSQQCGHQLLRWALEYRRVAPTLARLSEVLADFHAEHLAKLHAPLVKRVDAPDPTLNCSPVLVHREERAQEVGIACGQEQGQRWPISSEDLVLHQILGNALLAALLCCLPHGQRIRLGEVVGHELIMV